MLEAVRAIGLVTAAAVTLAASMALAQSAPPVDAPTAPNASIPAGDLQTRDYLLGAAFARSDLSTDQTGGMMFLPGRGLIRWETLGKTAQEQEEARIEAIGLADARAVQAEIDARAAAIESERQRSVEIMAMRERALINADIRATPQLSLSSVTGTDREAGGVAPLNRAARNAVLAAMGVRDGTQFKGRNRVYLFGAVSGRGVGLNLLHDEEGGWANAGLSTDTGGFIGQRQAGLALRSGSAQAALSYVQEKTWAHILGVTEVKDHRAMLNFSLTSGLPKPIPHPEP